MFQLVERITPEELLEPLAQRFRSARTSLSLLQRVATPEWVITPSFGMRRWITTQMAPLLHEASKTDGIVAHWQHDFPSKLTGRVLDAHLEATTGRLDDPWGIAHLQFLIHDWASSNVSHPAAAPLLSSSGVPLLSRSRQFADLFDRYFTWRPELILSWINGAQATSTMGEEEVLQSALFLELRRHIAVATPVERWKEAWGNVGGYSHALPAADRLTIIGPYSLPGADRYVEAIQSLSAHMDVAMYAPTSGPIELLETSDESKTEAHRLWGGAQRSIAPMVRRLHAMSETNVALAQQPLPTTVLGALQRAIITDELFSIGSPDNSLVVHGCYGEARQAEVLRDAILHDLAESDNEKFGESNILVVCPDLATFAPLIRSAFGEPRREELTASKGTEPQLAFTIVDPQGSSEGLYLRGLRHFIELINGRCQRTEVLSFFEEPTVARALRFTQDSTALHDTWTRAAGIRWGLSGSHREHLGLGSLGNANTWAAGLRRMSLGVLVDNPSLRTAGGILPVEIAPGHLDEYAAFALGVRHLATAHDGRIAPLPLAKWLDWFDRSRHALLLAEGDLSLIHI